MSKHPKKRKHRRPSKAARRKPVLSRETKECLRQAQLGIDVVLRPITHYPPTYFGVQLTHE